MAKDGELNEPTPEEMVQFVMGDTTKMTPEEKDHVESIRSQYTDEVLEIYHRVRQELAAEGRLRE